MLMFLEDIVLREKLEWPSSSDYLYEEAEDGVDN
jgi:hypothetical protein